MGRKPHLQPAPLGDGHISNDFALPAESGYRRRMYHLFLVMFGGAIGAGARHLTGRATLALLGPTFPWGTLAVNLIGGFAMGALVAWLGARSGGNEPLRYLLGVGVLGGFTTFSAFSLDAVQMLQRGDHGIALAYILASAIGSIVALFAGLQFSRAFA